MSNRKQCNIDFQKLNQSLKDCPDVIGKKVYIDGNQEAFFLYISDHIDKDIIQRDFIKPILGMSIEELSDKKAVLNLPCSELSFLYDSEEVLFAVFSGSSVFLSPALPYAISYTNTNTEKRPIDEPVTEKNVRGPHEGFIESFDANISTLRRKIRNEKLKFKTCILGKTTNQKIALAYIEGLTNSSMVDALFKKLKNIKLDGLAAVGYIEQSLISHPHSLFPQYLATERPDKAAAELLAGRIVIIMEGTPVVLIAPVTFFSFFQALDDYSTMWTHETFLRVIRIFGSLFIAVLLPSFYIAITSFHYFAVPLTLLTTLAETRAKVPFPPIIEILILEITVELLREAAIRLPTYIGTAISVVSALIIGQSAVEAGIVSGLAIVIVGATAVGSYVIPSSDMALSIRILRFIFIICSAIFGIMGIVVCSSWTLAHLLALDSLGQPYLAPISPFSSSDMKDIIFRLPLNRLQKKPVTTKNQDQTRS